MKNSLPRLTTLAALVATFVALAQPTTAAPGNARPDAAAGGPFGAAEALTPGDRLLVQAMNQLERRRSVTARLNHHAFVRGHRVHGRGSYWQQGRGDELRVRLELQIMGQEASLLQVSNSPFLWVDRRLPSGRTVTLVDLRQLRADPQLAAADFENIRPGEASWSAIQSDLLAHSGGLPRLLAALSKNFSFLPPQAMRLVSPGESQPPSTPFFAVVGHWKPEKLAVLVGSQESSVEGRGPEVDEELPDRLPREVLLLFGQSDLFPYRVEYRQLETPPPAGVDGPAVAYQLSSHPMAVLELSEVAFDVPIAAGQFDYSPRDVEWVDQTAEVLERLRRERESKVAVRAEASSIATPKH